MEILYWHWIVFGIGLVLIELALPSFTALWFGLGAAFVGCLLWINPDFSITFQISAWAFVSAGLTLIWYKVLRPSKNSATPPPIEEIDGRIGLAISIKSGNRLGKIRFTTPINDLDEWNFECEEEVKIGDQLSVIGTSEHHLIVKKLSKKEL